MPRFRKKPVVIEAVRFAESGALSQEVADFIGHGDVGDVYNWLNIQTLEGTMEARPGDWIIKGIQGEIYPCKPDIFEATYELAD